MASSVTKLKPLPADPVVRAMYLQAEATKLQATNTLEAAKIGAEATKAAAESQAEFTAALREMTERLGPAADAIHNLAEAQRKLCDFLVKHRGKLLLSIPIAITVVQSISPTTAKILADLARAYGVIH